MYWNTIEDVVQEMKLQSLPDDFDGLKEELRILLAEFHPDKTGGAFPSKDDEVKYNKVSSAYKFVTLASRESTTLIPITQFPNIIMAVRDTQLLKLESHVSQLRSECRNETHIHARARNIMPRVCSGSIAAICGFLFTFSGNFTTHPILGKLTQNNWAQIILLILAGYAGGFFILTWSCERIEEEQTEWFLSEQGRRELVEKLLKQIFDQTTPNAKLEFCMMLLNVS